MLFLRVSGVWVRLSVENRLSTIDIREGSFLLTFKPDLTMAEIGRGIQFREEEGEELWGKISGSGAVGKQLIIKAWTNSRDCDMHELREFFSKENQRNIADNLRKVPIKSVPMKKSIHGHSAYENIVARPLSGTPIRKRNHSEIQSSDE